MTSHEQIRQIETKLERDRRVLLIAQMAAVFLGTLLLIVIVGACSGCGETPQVNILAAHGGGGITLQVGGVVVQAEFDEAAIVTADGTMGVCSIVTAVAVNGAVLGRGAVEALSAPECGGVYGWFPAGLVVGAHDGLGRDVGATSGEGAGLGADGDLGIVP